MPIMNTGQSFLLLSVYAVVTSTYYSEMTQCSEVQFVGLPDLDVITVEDGKELSVTFYVITHICREQSSQKVIQLTKSETNFTHHVCRVILENQTCDVSGSSIHCRCLNGTVAQFHKMASFSDEGTYDWSFADKNKVERNITFRIIPARTVRVALPVSVTVLLTVFFVVTAASVHWIIQRKRQGGGRGNYNEVINRRPPSKTQVIFTQCEQDSSFYDEII